MVGEDAADYSDGMAKRSSGFCSRLLDYIGCVISYGLHPPSLR